MERSHTPLTVWFSAAHLLVTHSGGLNARQFQSQLGLSRYATVFQILHKLRSRMAPPANERLGAEGRSVAAVWVGESINLDGKTSIELSRAIAVVEIRTEDENKGTDSARRHTSRLPERMRLHVMPDRSATALVGFIADHVTPGTKVVTGDDSVDLILTTHGYKSFGEADRLERNECLTTARLVAAQLQHHLDRHHRGVSKQHLQAYLDEFSFRLNHASHPDKAFRTLLGMETPC
jgi:transposase-like protein